jgi:hypothetical protein
MRGQMALEFFFAMALVYLSVFWLSNFLNAGYDSGRFLALREERLVAAQLAGIANSACVLNLSATLSAPCMVLFGRPAGYYVSSEGNWVVVASALAPQAARAKSLCNVHANLTEYNATLGGLVPRQVACDNALEGPLVCVRPDGAASASISAGRCGS